MTFVIYKMGDEGRRKYVTDIPDDDNPIGGIGYTWTPSGEVPSNAGTSPTEQDALKVCKYLRTACYGPPDDHFYEKAPEGHAA
ncbi:hypothetical protein [Pseudomonas sp. PS01300]|uniref:hypothetical protein n=1 Tax=Pseudomonas sp. PS01300 TaxID=2991436 RepID=UPI00249C0594|nr:hypothetical protein [Pseudomonas sp. PS01300]